MGVVGVLVFIGFRGEFSITLVLDALQRTTGAILWVTFGATTLAGAYSIAGGPTYVANSIIGMDLAPMGVILMMMLIVLFMGAFMDWVGIVLLAMPVFLPLVWWSSSARASARASTCRSGSVSCSASTCRCAS
jgi:TRAP-type mannitol/chloroaromatic compound transport system permease large subunit